MKQIAPNIWVFDGEAVNFHSFPFTTRMTVVILSDGGLWVHSPIKLDATLKEKIDALGPVKYIIAPNHLHHIFVDRWQANYPNARSFGTAEVIKKCQDLTFDEVLSENFKAPWLNDIEQLLFTGSPAMQECIFFHKASKVLIVTDLIENFPPNSFTFFKRQIAKLTGIIAPNGKMPIDWRFSFYPKRSEARRHIQKILSWHPQVIILSHGLIIEENAEAFIKRAFKWVKLPKT